MNIALEPVNQQDIRPSGEQIGSWRLQKRYPKWIGVLAILLVLVMSTLLLVDRLMNPQYFQIREVLVDGQFQYGDIGEIRADILSGVEGNFFSIDLVELAQYIESLPWVYNASLRLVWPDILVAEIEEVNPVARWGEHQWLHTNGAIVDREQGFEGDQLPFLSGAESRRDKVMNNYKKWSLLFAEKGVVLSSLVLDERALWRLQLNADYFTGLDIDSDVSLDGDRKVNHAIELVVPMGQATEKIQRFLSAFSHDFINQFLHMENVDLRYPNGFTVRWSESKEMLEDISVNENSVE